MALKPWINLSVPLILMGMCQSTFKGRLSNRILIAPTIFLRHYMMEALKRLYKLDLAILPLWKIVILRNMLYSLLTSRMVCMYLIFLKCFHLSTRLFLFVLKFISKNSIISPQNFPNCIKGIFRELTVFWLLPLKPPRGRPSLSTRHFQKGT